jgi:transcriptional antiterminator RfaH
MEISLSLEDPSWFCLKTQPKREHIAAAHLRRMQAVDVFSPRLRFKRATKLGLRWFEESMFPGYVFARFPFVQRYKEVQSAMGVSRILQFGGRYTAVSEPIIEALRAQSGPNEIAVIAHEIKEGDAVKVVDGTLGGLEAIVTQILSGRERVRILLEFLGREIHAEVNTDTILPANRHPLTK